jgi:hypothetical protein
LVGFGKGTSDLRNAAPMAALEGAGGRLAGVGLPCDSMPANLSGLDGGGTFPN